MKQISEAMSQFVQLHLKEILKWYYGRIVIAVGLEHVLRIGEKEDIQVEVNIRAAIPEHLQAWIPPTHHVHVIHNLFVLEESHFPRASDPRKILKSWVAAREEHWKKTAWEGPIEDGLRLINPRRGIDVRAWSIALKKLKISGEKIPIPVQTSKIRRLLRNKISLDWHRGWVHGDLRRNRIREDGFLCWRQARADGLRGEDIGPYIDPLFQPNDIVIHVLKACWESNPLRAAHALRQLCPVQSTASFSQTNVQLNSHKGITQDNLRAILGCSVGVNPAGVAARALYRSRNLVLGGVPVRVTTDPVIESQKDDAFFLPRQRKERELFERFSAGIQLDKEGRYSLTPERHAVTIAGYFQSTHILDAFCGCGGNAIAFARAKMTVTAYDTHSGRLSMAKHNAQIYSVAQNIQFINGTCRHDPPNLPAIFLDPPWSMPSEEILEWWQWASERYVTGAIKLPIEFPIPSNYFFRVLTTKASYPSFAIVGWGPGFIQPTEGLDST